MNKFNNYNILQLKNQSMNTKIIILIKYVKMIQ